MISYHNAAIVRPGRRPKASGDRDLLCHLSQFGTHVNAKHKATKQVTNMVVVSDVKADFPSCSIRLNRYTRVKASLSADRQGKSEPAEGSRPVGFVLLIVLIGEKEIGHADREKLVDPSSCKRYAAASKERFEKRLADEKQNVDRRNRSR